MLQGKNAVWIGVACCVLGVMVGGEVGAQPAATQASTQAGAASQPGEERPVTFSKQMEAFKAADEKKAPAVKPTVFIGASSFTRWHEIPVVFKEFDGMNRAFGGSVLKDLIDHLDEVVIKYKPKAVVIWGGNSDITGGASVEKVFATYESLIEKIHAGVPEAQIFCLSIIPAPVRTANSDKLDAVSAKLKAYSQTHAYVHYIDARYALSDADKKPDPANYEADGLHPNKAGYAKLAPVISEALRSRGTAIEKEKVENGK